MKKDKIKRLTWIALGKKVAWGIPYLVVKWGKKGKKHYIPLWKVEELIKAGNE